VLLSVSEIRRLFWHLVLATQQKVARMLAWSTWRAGIKASPDIGTRNGVQAQKYNCSTSSYYWYYWY
jgi:hypothetical protein